MSVPFYRLYVTCPDGEKRIIQISQSGGFYDPVKILWDERTQGPMKQADIDAAAVVAAQDAALKANALQHSIDIYNSVVSKLTVLGFTAEESVLICRQIPS